MVAVARRTQSSRSAATRARLLEAALECLVEGGYGRLSTVDICKRAGVSRGAQLHHYPTKAELVAAAVEHVFVQRHAEFRGLLGEHSADRDGPGSPALSADSAFAALWEIYSGPTLYAWLELIVAARTDPDLKPLVAAVNERFFAEARATLCHFLGIDPTDDDPRIAAATRLVLSVFDGLAMNHILEGDRDRVMAVLTNLQPLLVGWSRELGTSNGRE